MRTKLTTVVFGALALPFLAGCATKGFVRKELATQRTSIDSSFASGMAMERSERMAGDSALRGDIQMLRRDLDSLRTEFSVKITALENGMQFAMPVNFAFDDATVRSEDMAALDKFAEVVQRHYAGSKITVEGFADPAGSTRYNLRLSKQRAESVKSYLTEKGIAEVAAIGFGESRQVVQGAERDEPGAEKNRRVVFVVESRGDAGVAIVEQPGN
ncbi:MAG: OmpA family protein [Gemmatimonadaceae bacterium]|nr:OmpA family protein [Gemmatimonadaceae bacterium]MDQ3518308.1 OmpA family protein [Gemmatimonadota bacterium]